MAGEDLGEAWTPPHMDERETLEPCRGSPSPWGVGCPSSSTGLERTMGPCSQPSNTIRTVVPLGTPEPP